jgi:hypothetical protein
MIQGIVDHEPSAMAKTASKPTLPPLPKAPAAPVLEPVAIEAAPAPPVIAEPLVELTPRSESAEVAHIKTRYGFPVYVPTQRKLLAPNEICPLIVDSWVRNQLTQERGALVRVEI